MTARRILGVIAALALALPAAAETMRSEFRVSLLGLPVGTMATATNTEGAQFAASASFKTTGVVGLIAKVRFDMVTRGSGAFPNFATQYYREDMNTGYRASSVELSFSSGESRIDPLTAILAGLNDRALEKGCDFAARTFDGQRSMALRITAVRHTADELVCTGVAERLSGYTAEEMAKVVDFPFVLEFEKAGDVLLAERLQIETIHGKVVLVRR